MMIEAGLLQKWIRRYWPQNECGIQTIGAAHALSLEETVGAFIILLTGLSSAIAALLLENQRDKLKSVFLKLFKMFHDDSKDVKQAEIKIHTND